MHVGGQVFAARAGEIGKLSLLLRRERDVNADGRTPIQ
jgi:hypothetical protein